ncbi:MAG TPA: molybdopterin molybdotransferase MoeA [Candidatus Didemnitutus sp.]|jgi:molybdopterin molybdotransferase
MISVAQAQEQILSRAATLNLVAVALEKAAGRILGRNACADADSPPFDASAMDGFACRRADLPGPLAIAGASRPGRPFAGRPAARECVSILTGAPVPEELDCVIKQEDTAREGDAVRVLRHDDRSFVRHRGENRRAGEVVVPAGTRLAAPELAALAGIGIVRPEVVRAARCVHIVTGDELVAPESAPGIGAIRDSNSILVATLIASARAELVQQSRCGDDDGIIGDEVRSAPDHDVLLLSGGAGPGDRDPARAVLSALGYEIVSDGVNLRPGKPLIHATRGRQHAFALPGNPVSHWVVFQLFVAPLLRTLQGCREPRPVLVRGRIGGSVNLPPPDPRPTYWPCHSRPVGGEHELSLLPIASSGDALGLVGANALLPLPAPPAILQAGQPIEFIPCA